MEAAVRRRRMTNAENRVTALETSLADLLARVAVLENAGS